MKVNIDREVCTGHGRCYTLASNVFQADDEGYPILLHSADVPDDLVEVARKATLVCPEGALSLSD